MVMKQILTQTEENYIKCIYKKSINGSQNVSTNTIAASLKTRAATVSDMIKKLAEKGLITYEKYQGVNISDTGKTTALKIIRKHRLWEVFLVNHLKFNWDEVHEAAEQLEHIKSPLLIERLDEFLNHPKFDPHGDPIPDENGVIPSREKFLLSEAKIGTNGRVMGVNDSSTTFLQHLDKIGINLNTNIIIIDKIEYDGSMEIEINFKKRTSISKQIANNIFISV